MSSEGASACYEAVDLVNGARQESYGTPEACMRQIGRGWGAILGGADLEPTTVTLMMIWLKTVREANKHGRDNLVDIAGYVEIADMANARR